MPKKNDITDAELAALAAIVGTPPEPQMAPTIKARLLDLYLIERRKWPNGPLWRTSVGERLVRVKSRHKRNITARSQPNGADD